MIGLNQYVKIRNHYGLCYLGPSDEYILQLLAIRPYLEKTTNGILITLICKDDCWPLLQNTERVIKISEMKKYQGNFGYVREIRSNNIDHPVEVVMTECGLEYCPIAKPKATRTRKCVIITKGTHPTKPLIAKQIDILKNRAISQGFEVELNTDTADSGLVMGVESVGLFQAANQGIETVLVPTGIGTRLYKKLYPNNAILKL